MFAVFGDIVFEVLGSPEAFTSTRAWDYAEHRVVEASPKLQWLAPSLETIELDFHFHVSFADPATQVAALLAAADEHSALPLVFGNGIHRGYFIVTSIRTTTQQMSANGNLLAITMRAALKEWPLASEIASSGSAAPSYPSIGVVAALPGATTGSIAYPGGTGVTATVGVLGGPFVAPSISAPGVSAILNLPTVAGLTAPQLGLGDVPPGTIVRAAG